MTQIDVLASISMSLAIDRKDLMGALNLGFIVLIAILLISASSVAILVYEGTKSESSPALHKAKWGDTVKVDYIGRFADGRVFDTSLWDVASNNAMYPKSLSFTLRNQSEYEPLQFRIGSGQMIRGFERGIIGMAVNETRVIVVSPQDGYGELDESKLVTLPLVEEIPVFESYNITTFVEKFSVYPKDGLTEKDPKWGWDIICLEVNPLTNKVLVMNTPAPGEIYKIYVDSQSSSETGWYVEVESVESSANGGAGIIRVHHLLTSSDAGMIKGMDEFGKTFYLHEVDENAGKIVLNYNSELVGKTLYFTVTLLDIL
ncbi:MAG: FKBP-type peptidyl-prolyl cis-trans isomerase [Methanomassiliicoccales archaeon]|jgi:FKBP-type peptidyl-prolyl cis-trans isomerase 2|nr:FKBP-type peptidyl-prolyl cis-trans isomerase [Methanomassiliicoccales archaeon]